MSSTSAHYASISSSNGSMGDLTPEYATTDGEPRNKIVVLGVPWQTEDTSLEQHFGQFGEVLEAQIMRERYTGKSRGFGFITFTSPDDAQRAVAAEHLIDGRRCEAKFALPEGKVGSARTTRIFVARIPSSLTDFQFRAYFEQFGIVQDAYMPKDPSKQGHRGIGFVTYSTSDAVDRVMQSTHVLNGNEIAIDRATPKERVALLPGRLTMSQPNLQMLSGAGGSAHGGAHFGFLATSHHYHPPPHHHGGHIGSSPTRLHQENYLTGRPTGSGMGIGRPMSHPALNSATALQVGSPPSTLVTANGVRSSPNNGQALGAMKNYSGSGANLTLLAQAQAQVQAALQHQLSSGSLHSEHSGSPSRLINLLNANAAAAAGGTNNVPVMNLGSSPSMGNVTGSGVNSASDLAGLLAQQQQQQQHDPNHATAVGGTWAKGSGGRALAGHGTGTGSSSVQQGPASARAGPRIFVGKLSKETTEQDVKDYFTRFGYVMDVYLPRDKANKREHRGFGFVTFETEASIQRVVSHGPHQVGTSIVAIDSAVPRQDEMIFKADNSGGMNGISVNSRGPQSPETTAAEAMHSFEVLSLDGSNHGRRLVQNNEAPQYEAVM